MVAYSDPTGTGFLEQAGALQLYRELVDVLHQQFHAQRNSGFTLREAFDELTHAVRWKAFPVTADASPDAIDDNRFTLQDESASNWHVIARLMDFAISTVGWFGTSRLQP
jgi:hypothetical protein